METTRTFLAVFPPVTVVERVADALESVRQALHKKPGDALLRQKLSELMGAHGGPPS